MGKYSKSLSYCHVGSAFNIKFMGILLLLDLGQCKLYFFQVKWTLYFFQYPNRRWFLDYLYKNTKFSRTLNSYVPSFQQHLIIYAYQLTIADL